MIGSRLRAARQGSGMSLTDVAVRAKISAATLSRIETGKQSIDAELLVLLTRIIGITASDVFGENSDGTGSLARTIATMDARDLTELWRMVMTERSRHRPSRNHNSAQVESKLDELVAHLDFVRTEIEALRHRIHAKKK